MRKILVTGATGQIGCELTPALRGKFGDKNVVAAGHKREPGEKLLQSGPYLSIDVRNKEDVLHAVKVHRIDTIFHLASLLSAVAEVRPQLAWDVNMNGLGNVLEIAREHHCAVFFPSSIGAFGPSTPPEKTPQDTIQRPSTMYGVTKVSGELLCDYYQSRFGVDTRGVRYPGLISHETLPGGGTTDYAVHIFYAALKDKHYECFLRADTRLDMMYMPDAVSAAVNLMEANADRLTHRNAYNITAMSVSPQQLAEEIKKHIPGFTMTYKVDPIRQAIAQSWPRHMDDSAAREEWSWEARFGLSAMVKDMLDKLS